MRGEGDVWVVASVPGLCLTTGGAGNLSGVIATAACAPKGSAAQKAEQVGRGGGGGGGVGVGGGGVVECVCVVMGGW